MRFLKFLFRFTAFILCLLTLLAASSFVFHPKNNSASSGMEQPTANGILGERENTIDVLVLGDSEAYSGISPIQIWKNTGYTSYVCSSAGQTLDYTTVLLSRALENQQPKYVFLETDTIYTNVTTDKAFLTSLGESFSVFRYHDRWKSLSISDFFKGVKFTWKDDYKGYIYSNSIVSVKPDNYMRETDAVKEVSDQNMQYISDIKELCDDNGAELILLSTPSVKNWNYEKHNGIRQIADELECEYIDLNLKNDELKIDWAKDTRDAGDHLNYSGAVKVTNYLSDYLESKGDLTDHRNDVKYGIWYTAEKKYDTVVKTA